MDERVRLVIRTHRPFHQVSDGHGAILAWQVGSCSRSSASSDDATAWFFIADANLLLEIRDGKAEFTVSESNGRRTLADYQQHNPVP